MSADSKKRRILTGLQPSGSAHLGNYFGAIEPALELGRSDPLFLFLADFHILNNIASQKENQDHCIDLAATLIACGLDYEKHTFYSQSLVPEVCELTWVLSCQAPFGMLTRAHSFKDKQAKGVEVNAGLFGYPVLMAADILLYKSTHVPVGKDQKQHLEITRDLATRFNNHYGNVLINPEPLISESVGLIPGTDGEKMSKSKNNVVSIFATDKQWKKQIMSIVTDSAGVEEKKNPDECHVFNLYRRVANESKVEEMRENYTNGGFGYGHAKLALLECMKERFGEKRDRYFELKDKPNEVRDILDAGAQKARKVAKQTIGEVKEALGLFKH